ncbi:MAG: hypothetical protein ACJ736_10560 [Streptomyces sp.]
MTETVSPPPCLGRAVTRAACACAIDADDGPACLRAVNPGVVPDTVQDDAAQLRTTGGGLGRAAQRPDPGDEFGEVEGFGQAVVGAELFQAVGQSPVLRAVHTGAVT